MKFDKLLTSGNVWITSDTHYHHTNICRGVTRWRTLDGKIPIAQTRNFQDLSNLLTQPKMCCYNFQYISIFIKVT